MRTIETTIVAAAIALSPAQSAPPGPEAAEAVAFIQRFAKAESREAYASFCDADTVIIDHVPPYVFLGPNACADEWDAVLAWTSQNNIAVSDWGSIQDPAFIDATDNKLYAVFPSTASLTWDGRNLIQRGMWTFVLRHEDDGWRVASMAWSTLAFDEASTPVKRP